VKAILVGIDVATVEAKVGLARATYIDGTLQLEDALLCTRSSPVDTIAGWLQGGRDSVLLAIDAPLGWPEPLATSLASHRAGERIRTPPNEMFRRATDRFIRRELSKTPLDVGADRIARTAHAALTLLGDLRQRLGAPIPLAWSPRISGTTVIEVYPAATLVAHGIRSNGYKARDQGAERGEILTALRQSISLGPHAPVLRAHADALDAVVCLLAGMDFLENRAMAPPDLAVARREGWIWAAARTASVRTPSARTH
jgi:predicted RNase H-like nuclease